MADAYGFNSDKSKFALDQLIGDNTMIEESPATTNHSVGDYIVYESQLYKVTAAITTGEDLEVGTNVSLTSVSSELAVLQDSLTGEYDFNNASNLNDAIQKLYNSLSAGYHSGSMSYNGVGIFQAIKWQNGTGVILEVHNVSSGVVRVGFANGSPTLTFKNVTLT